MKSVRSCFFTLALLLLVVPAFAQSEKKLIKQAEANLKQDDKINALNLYLKAHEKNPENARTNFMIGKLYLETIYKTRSRPYLEKAYAVNPKIDPQINWCLGESYHFSLMFDKAIEHYQLSGKTDVAKKDPEMGKTIARRIEECKVGKELVSHPVEVKIENIGQVVNSPYPDFAPVISADESVLIFTSRRQGTTGGGTDENGEYNEDIYISRKVDGKWSAPENIGTNINSSGHDASVGLSADGKELFTYDGDGQGDIKYCKLKKDSTWSKPFLMQGNINTKSSETSICISPDQTTVFFTSDREGGYGGFDIYMSRRDSKGNWGKASNLGPAINTASDEEGPFLDLDGRTLYFSSRAHRGMGGYDIFKSVYDSSSGKWSEPENIGYPINTPDNDIYFVLSGDGRHAYFASVRDDGLGEKDIYMITMPERKDHAELVRKMEVLLKKEVKETPAVVSKVTEEVKPVEQVKTVEPVKVALQPVILKGTIRDKVTGTPLAAAVQLLDAAGNVVDEMNTAANGVYLFEMTAKEAAKYTIAAARDAYGFVSKNVAVPASGSTRAELVNDLALQKLEAGRKFVLRNIYFDFDKATIKPVSETELKKLLKLLKENPEIKVEIAGHTDSKGGEGYNKVLSQKRAESVVKWLVMHGVNQGRLSARGYGEEKPLATNDDEEEGREFNRRTEFEVLE